LKKLYSLFLAVLLVGLFSQFLALPTVHAQTVEWESNTEPAIISDYIFGNYCYSQLFTVGMVGHSVTSVSLFIYSFGNPSGNATVAIRAIVNSYPSGPNLTIGTIAPSSLQPSSPAWVSFAMSPYNLSAYTRYCIILSFPSGTINSPIVWLASSSTENLQYSIDGGNTWSFGVTGQTFTYQIWGNVVSGMYPYVYTFIGPIDEASGTSVNQTVTVSVYQTSGVFNFTLNGNYTYYSAMAPQFFEEYLGGNVTRIYYPVPAYFGDSETVYVFLPDSPYYTYYVSITDVLGITNAYVESYISLNGSNVVVERRPYSMNNLIPFTLHFGGSYGFRIWCSQGFYDNGVTTPADPSTPVSITVSALNFPSTAISYGNLTVFTQRTSATTIQVLYQDLNNETGTVSTQIYQGSQLMDSDNQTTSGTYSLTWNNAQPTLTYTVTVTSSTSYYGTLSWSWTLPPYSITTSSFNLSFLGNWLGVDGAQVFGFFLCLLVFGCFSSKDRYVGTVITVFLAGFLTYIGWLNIPTGMLTFVGSLAILYALSNRRPA